jgi:uncharacterized protein YndB with AHSA1/START domain
VIERLTRGPATVSELAGLLGVTVAATVQHRRGTKAAWFAPPDGCYELDVRVGGTESVHGPAGTGLVARSRYHDIVPGERIVYSTALTGWRHRGPGTAIR